MSDDLIWHVINHQFCSYKLVTPKGQNFCRNEYNVTGLCNRQSCPLANSKYATVRSIDGKLYLYIKTAERQHMPKKMWERIKLSKNYQTALQQIDDHLIYWNKFLIHKCKQRMTRYFQVAIRQRREAKKVKERELVGHAPKVRRREETRERKALAAGKIEKAIEKELLERLKSGAYGESPLNVDEQVWKKVLGNMRKNHELEEDELNSEDEELEEELEEDDEDVGQVEYVEEDENEDEEDIVQLEDLEKWLGAESDSSVSSRDSDSESEEEERPKKKKKKMPRVEVEYEHEDSNPQQKEVAW